MATSYTHPLNTSYLFTQTSTDVLGLAVVGTFSKRKLFGCYFAVLFIFFPQKKNSILEKNLYASQNLYQKEAPSTKCILIFLQRKG